MYCFAKACSKFSFSPLNGLRTLFLWCTVTLRCEDLIDSAQKTSDCISFGARLSMLSMLSRLGVFFFNLWGSWVMGHGSCWGPNIFFLGAYGIREVEVWWCSGSGEPGDPGGTLGDLGPMHRGWQWLSYLASTPKRATGRCRHRQKWTFWRSDLDRSCEATRVATTCNELTLPCSPFDSVEEDLWALLSGTWQWCLGSKKKQCVGRWSSSDVQCPVDFRQEKDIFTRRTRWRRWSSKLKSWTSTSWTYCILSFPDFPRKFMEIMGNQRNRQISWAS